METLRLGTSDESPLQASKWLQLQMLIDDKEMQRLFETLSPFSLFLCGSLCKAGEGELSKEGFLKHYSAYISALKLGQEPADLAAYRKWFSPAMTRSSEALYRVAVGDEQEGRQLIRIAKPVIQIQANNVGFSSLDDKFRPMIFGAGSISWGIQFSYPQIFMDHATKQVIKIVQSSEFPNTSLFRALQKWARDHTIPTPFLVSGKKVNSPIRLGKECLPWINQHPHLKLKGISVSNN